MLFFYVSYASICVCYVDVLLLDVFVLTCIVQMGPSDVYTQPVDQC